MKRHVFLNPPRHAQGVALLTVLLIVAIATITAIAMASRQKVDIRKTENIVRMDQAWQNAHGIDNWAVGCLRSDQDENETDSSSDVWNEPMAVTDIEGGEVSAKIEDQQGRFNLNNLVNNGNKNTTDVARFRRLLQELELNPGLADAVMDWLDEDTQVRFPDGAEDEAYSTKELPYRAANGLFAHPSELLLVQGMDEEVFNKLQPYITVLPGSTTINVNTASVPVLMSLADGLTSEDAATLQTERDENPFPSVEDFLAHSAVAGLGLEPSGLSTDSHYFMVAGDVNMGRIRLRHNALIHRQMDGKIRVIQRTRKGWFDE